MSEVSYPLEGTDSSVGDKAWEKSSKDWAVGLEGGLWEPQQQLLVFCHVLSG